MDEKITSRKNFLAGPREFPGDPNDSSITIQDCEKVVLKDFSPPVGFFYDVFIDNSYDVVIDGLNKSGRAKVRIFISGSSVNVLIRNSVVSYIVLGSYSTTENRARVYFHDNGPSIEKKLTLFGDFPRPPCNNIYLDSCVVRHLTVQHSTKPVMTDTIVKKTCGWPSLVTKLIFWVKSIIIEEGFYPESRIYINSKAFVNKKPNFNNVISSVFRLNNPENKDKTHE